MFQSMSAAEYQDLPGSKKGIDKTSNQGGNLRRSMINVTSTNSINPLTQSRVSKKSLATLSPQAQIDIEREMRVTASQTKIVFRDFSVPTHQGRGRVDP